MKNKGFTLIETLVSLLLFSIISTISINVFIIAIKTQDRIITNQELVEKSAYALNYMNDKIRMAIKDEVGTCNGSVSNYGVGGDSISFLSFDPVNNRYICREFLLEDNIIKLRISTDETSISLGDAVPLTSSDVNVSNLRFSITGDDEVNQPRVTTAMTMSKLNSSMELTVQTTVSQRQLNL